MTDGYRSRIFAKEAPERVYELDSQRELAFIDPG